MTTQQIRDFAKDVQNQKLTYPEAKLALTNILAKLTNVPESNITLDGHPTLYTIRSKILSYSFGNKRNFSAAKISESYSRQMT